MPTYATAHQSATWLRERMDELAISGLDDLADRAGTDKGNLSRIFRQRQRPRVDALEPLAAALEVSVYELLVVIGAVDPGRTDIPAMPRSVHSNVAAWSRAG